jgi:LPXTG-site transpeptidase (sortase) family protein
MPVVNADRVVRIAGAGLCIAGAVLIGHAGFRYARGAYQADLARQQWEARQAQSAVAAARERVANSVTFASRSLAVGTPVARLRIPRIGLDEIVIEGVGDDELNAGPGHLPGSALPGMPGNAVISAHRDRHFSRLDALQLGDTIRTETGQSNGIWVIVGRRIIDRNAPALFQSKEPVLTLTTCWPVRYFGSAPDRLILTAKQVGAAAAVSRGSLGTT